MRYREKRKSQRFEKKTIQYASHKAYMETLRRMKGRLTKRKSVGADVEETEHNEEICSSAAMATLMAPATADADYGVNGIVTSF
jgi:hypothetical protein